MPEIDIANLRDAGIATVVGPGASSAEVAETVRAAVTS